ncbi:transcriptional repressor p66-alpha [Pimephales promelas]|nr:transcriptional repressor p66-alpha [Pimephales promelas]
MSILGFGKTTGWEAGQNKDKDNAMPEIGELPRVDLLSPQPVTHFNHLITQRAGGSERNKPPGVLEQIEAIQGQGCNLSSELPPDTDSESRTWLKALNLKKPPRTVYVCSYHFVDQKPTKDNPFPELWLGYNRPPQPKRRQLTQRTTVSTQIKKRRLASEDAPETCQPACEAEPATPKFRDAQTQWEDPSHIDHMYCSTTQSVKVDKATQCEAEMGPTVTSTTVIDDARSRLYTGVRMVQFFTLVTVLLPFSKLTITLPVVDQILMTLMKLKLNLILGDIAHRFNVSTSMASIVISHWIDVMGEQFKVLIPWLPRETIHATMPLSFQRNYPRTTCIIDCAESAMQRATNHDSRSDTFSQYKSRNTVKYLVAVAPNGLIMFISDA